MNKISVSNFLAASLSFTGCASISLAQEALPQIEIGAPQPFGLGQNSVGEQKGSVAPRPPVDKNADSGAAPRQHEDSYGGSTISSRQMETFARDSLDRAVNIAPGVNSETTGGPRNEQNIYVRGFDRWQVPITIDGVRVFLPADNRLDFARFLTPDIAEVQIAKGYVSVLDGPGGMGGAINLVSRKPSRAVEAEMRSGTEFGRDGTYEGVKSYGYLGTKQDGYYAQVSGTWRDLRGWMLPASFTPTIIQGAGQRDFSGTSDWNVGAKVGVTPNATDEYSLSFIHQDGKKGVPFHIADPISGQRDWTWPYWRIQNLYWLSNTKIGDASYVKTKAYWNKFDNSIISYDDPFFVIQKTPKSFNSHYTDYALGAGVEAGTEIAGVDTLKAMLDYRFDNHGTWQEDYGVNSIGGKAGCLTNVVCFTQPLVTSQEDIYSVAVENTYRPTNRIDLVQGFSYDWRHLRQAQDFNSSPSAGSPFGVIRYTVHDASAPNFQGAAIWRYTDTEEAHFNVSDRERFPTLFERFSTRFGGATSNPSLTPERAINFDLGWASQFAPRSKVTVDAFYSIVRNLIQNVPVLAYGPNVTQSQNVGDGRFWGAEATIDYTVQDNFSLGGNLTIMRRRVYAPYILNFQPIGVPDVKMFLYAGYRPIDGLTLTPSVEIAGTRWTSNTAGTIYYRTGAYFLTNFRAEYQITPTISASGGARNLFDVAYTLTDGFPEQGRSFYLEMKSTF
jgi:iron complex outermembrane receptor protein